VHVFHYTVHRLWVVGKQTITVIQRDSISARMSGYSVVSRDDDVADRFVSGGRNMSWYSDQRWLPWIDDRQCTPQSS